MRSISVILFFLFAHQSIAQQIELIELRESCRKAFRENDPSLITNALTKINASTTTLLDGYRSISFFLEARKAFSPFEKIKYFIKGKNSLENCIIVDPVSVELRFLRFCIQTNIPFFLGYSGNIKNDKNFIMNCWSILNDPDLKERIRDYMLNSDYCNIYDRKKLSDG